MEEIPNIYEWNDAQDILYFFSYRIFQDKYGIKSITSANEEVVLFYDHCLGRYILPSKDDKVKYLGDAEWDIEEK